jgi:hypothetical protein
MKSGQLPMSRIKHKEFTNLSDIKEAGGKGSDPKKKE